MLNERTGSPCVHLLYVWHDARRIALPAIEAEEDIEMATWKRLTDIRNGRQFDVNIDCVKMIDSEAGGILLHFPDGSTVGVKERADEIHKQTPINL